MKRQCPGQLSINEIIPDSRSDRTVPPARRHVPSGDLRQMRFPSFEQALADANVPQSDYDIGRWLFVPPVYTEYRYLLGTRGKRPLICIGINPSTARPDHLDPTLQSVERIALGNGFDSFLMMNLCAQRATDPNDMSEAYPQQLKQENERAFEFALRQASGRPVVWCAWGAMIEKRSYLTELLKGFVRTAGAYDPEWVCYGDRSKRGHPHHPLYLRRDAAAEPFDIGQYIASLSLE